MKEFFQKKRKVILLLLSLLFLLGFAAILYFVVLKKELTIFKEPKENTQETEISNEENTETKKEIPPMPEYDERSSTEAVEATYIAAQKWSDDAKLYECTGLPSTVEFEEITYEYIGAVAGKYYRWLCTYYSKEKRETKIFGYVGGQLDDYTEAIAIGEYADLSYNSVKYPEDLSKIVDSKDIYANALKNDLDEQNYINMYLGQVGDYGYVWKLEERSKTQEDEYGIGLIQNTYIYDIYTGKLKDVVQKEIY